MKIRFYRKTHFSIIFFQYIMQDLQSFTKYLRQALVFREIAHYGKSSISIVQEFWTIIEKIFILAGTLGTSL